MAMTFVFFVIGLGLIIKGGDLFVGASVRLAEMLRIPRVAVGTTLVSLATTTPELVVSIMAGLKKEPDLALGNAVGSCVCNIGLILGASAAFKHIDVHPPLLRRPIVAMLVFGLLLFAMTLDLALQRWKGMLLIVGGVGYFAWDFIQHSRDTRPGDIKAAAAIEKEIATRFAWLHTRGGTVTQFLTGALLVIVGSRWLVSAAVEVAGILGIPTVFIGLTVVAIGTSLPELITAFASSQKNVSDISGRFVKRTTSVSSR
jgi:cation:H+ antiporter